MTIARRASAALLTLLLFCLGGCEIALPDVRDVYVGESWSSVSKKNRRPMREGDSQRLLEWMERHKNGWQRVSYTLAPGILVVFEETSGRESMMIITNDRMLYRDRCRYLTPSEFSELSAILKGGER